MRLFGMPTLVELPSLAENAALCRALELDFVELNMNLPQYQLDELNAREMLQIAQEYGVFFTFHLDENVNVCDFNTYLAQAYVRTVAETIELAQKIEAPVINMHLSSGVYFTLPQRQMYLFEQYQERYLQQIRAFRAVCEAKIGSSQVRICVENCDGFAPFQRRTLDELLASPAFWLTYDVGHNESYGRADEDCLLAHPEKMWHMHLHDAIGRKHRLPLGTGKMMLEPLLILAEKQGCRVVLETKTAEGLSQSVDWLRKKGL